MASKHERIAKAATPRPGPQSAGGPARRRPRWTIAALTVLAAVAMVATAVVWWLTRPTWSISRQLDQNVLLVTLDTVRADAVGSYGGRASTPNLDRLARLGARFDFAHAHAVVTLPAHASILTGLYPPQHGIRENSGYRLPATVPTLAGMLKPRGFATAAFVAAFPVDSRFGLNAGFDLYDDRYPGMSGGSEFRLPERRAQDVVSLATNWIQAQTGRWFVWVHVFDPHAPYAPPPPFDAQYGEDAYTGEVAYTDHALGPLFEAAARAGSRPTLVIATGDHGEALGDHGEATHGLFAYEATLRIPLIIAQIGPGAAEWTEPREDSRRRDGGAVLVDPARHVDLVPTVLDALHLPAAPTLPGRSLLSSGPASGPDGASYFEAMSASLNRGWAPLSGVLDGRRKYIDLPIQELYDLGDDPAEASNLADRRADLRRTLEARLRAFPSGEFGAARAADPEAAARLRALGYVTGSAAPKSKYTEGDDPKRLISLDQAIHRAVDLYQHGRVREAVPIYRTIIGERPSMEIAYLHLGMLHWDLGEPALAIDALRAALKAGIATEALRAKLGIYLAESGEVTEALPLLRGATGGEFPDLDALNALGIALARSGDAQGATTTFDRILSLSPSNAMALENLGAIALSRGDLAEARRVYTLALQSDPISAQARNGLGAVEAKSGNRKAAIEHWTVAVERDARNYDALFNLGTELLADGRPDEARPFLERFVRTAPPAFYAADIRRLEAVLARLQR